MDEPNLIERARQADGQAWESIMRQHQEAVFRLAYLLLGDADQAEDAAQETFIRAYRAFDRFDPSRPLRPWLLRITANLARNQKRSAGRYLAALRRLLVNDPKPAPGIEARVVERGEAATLWQATRNLRRAEQEVIYLRYFLDLPISETAVALGVAEGTVKSRLHRALAHLRSIISHDFPALQEGQNG